MKFPSDARLSDLRAGGLICCVFGGVGGSVRGAAGAFRAEAPAAVERALARVPCPEQVVDWVMGGPEGDRLPPYEYLLSNALLTAIHMEYLEGRAGIRPDASIGMSLGEASALLALGVWENAAGYFGDLLGAGTFDRTLSGEFTSVAEAWRCAPEEARRFRNWRILAPVSQVGEVASADPRVHVTTIHTAQDCIIGGHEDSCARLLASLPRARGQRFVTDLAVHCPEAEPFAPMWRRIHDRPIMRATETILFSHAECAPVPCERGPLASALTRQLTATVDFPRMVRAAYAQGVRTFIEMGPASGCAGFIRRILKGQPHVAFAMAG
jgi:acyl transferase domain-containing protein